MSLLEKIEEEAKKECGGDPEKIYYYIGRKLFAEGERLTRIYGKSIVSIYEEGLATPEFKALLALFVKYSAIVRGW